MQHSRAVALLLVLDRLSRGELPRDYIAGVSFLLGSIPYFVWLRIRDFDDLSKADFAAIKYPALFVLQPTTNFGLDATAWCSIGLWFTLAGFIICFIARRLCDTYRLRPVAMTDDDTEAVNHRMQRSRGGDDFVNGSSTPAAR